MATRDQRVRIEMWEVSRGTDRAMAIMWFFLAFVCCADIVAWTLGVYSYPQIAIQAVACTAIGSFMNHGNFKSLRRMPKNALLNLRSTYVAVDPSLVSEDIQAWVKENCRWPVAERRESIWEFWSEQDAMTFKLVWG